MKRPLIAAAVCLAAACALGTKTTLLSGIWPAAWLAAAGAALLIGSLNRRLAKLTPLVVLFALACLYVTGYQRVISRPIERLGRDDVLEVHATVLDFPEEYEENQRVPLRITSVGDNVPGEREIRAFKTLCYLPFMDTPLEPGDTLEARLSFYQPDIRDGFERQSYYASNGYFILARHDEDTPVRIEHHPAVWWSYPLRLAKSLKEAVGRQLPARQAGLLNAILFGDRSGMDSADERNLRKAGLSHMAAVSGMHVGFLTMFLCLVFGQRLGSFVSIFAILCFIPMAGASPSVIRASVMYIIMAVSFLRYEESEPLNSMAAALFVLLILNPFAVSSASLLLSFGATLGLLLFSSPLQKLLMQPFRKYNRFARKAVGAVMSALSCSLCSMAFTTPILLLLFGYVTILSPLANFLTLATVGIVFVLGLLLAVFGTFLPAICPPLAMLEGIFLSYILKVSDWIAHLPFGILSWGDMLGKAAIFFLYAGFFILLFSKKRKVFLTLMPICAISIAFSLFAAHTAQESTRLTILPSGAGQTLIYAAGRDSLTVIDCGGDKGHDSAEAVIEYLDWNGCEKIDTLLLTAVDKAHARYAAKLLRTGLVRSLVFPEIPESRRKELYIELLDTAERHGVPYQIGTFDTLPEGVRVWDSVERKLVVEVKIGSQRVLTVHSLTQKMLAAFLENTVIKTDILLLSENGIEDADLLRAALESIEPDELVLECGYINNESVLRRPCHNTKLEGEIVLAESKGGDIVWQ
ncbi:DUF4131 domain-containing protein [Butyricicoccus sp. 1XD8-22]|nr:DUF4131 domain-containing protein [Butyricicoccus sp. 1XD8-22]